jgi:N-acetylmuramoyl-L-alanine amidase
MRPIEHIVVHCADTPKGVYFDIDDIRTWHIKRGFSDVGYHYVILLDGTIQLGRPLAQQGAHVSHYNRKSIGICYIGGKGGDTRTTKQKASLVYLISTLKRTFRDAEVLGHHDFKGVTKTCPEFDPKTEYKNL